MWNTGRYTSLDKGGLMNGGEKGYKCDGGKGGRWNEEGKRIKK